MNEKTREAKALNEQEQETTMAGAAGMSEQQLEEVAGGRKKSITVHDHSCKANLGPRYKEKSVFGWNWYANCKICNKQFCLEWGPWSGDPD